MDMNKAFFIRKEDCKAKWHLVDASEEVLGRLSTKVAGLLRGKGLPEFSKHANCGDYVVIINCDKIKLTGDKWNSKEYVTYSGWRSGRKVRTAKQMMEKHPGEIIRLAVKRMLPKNKLSEKVIKRLKVYTGAEHPHAAQLK